MRLQTFDQVIEHGLPPYLNQIQYFLSDNFAGGWEKWLQNVVAYIFYTTQQQTCVREQRYPNSTQQCDFYISRTGTSADETYIELKCFKNLVGANLTPFRNDLAKITKLNEETPSLNCIAVIAAQGTPADMQRIVLTGIIKPVTGGWPYRAHAWPLTGGGQLCMAYTANVDV